MLFKDLSGFDDVDVNGFELEVRRLFFLSHPST